MSYSCIWDGFDNYDASHQVWDTVSGTPVYSSSYARLPAAPGCVSQGMRIPSSGGGVVIKNFSGNVNGPIAGFAVLFESIPSSGNQDFMGFGDSGTGQVALAINANGSLVVSRNYAFGTQLGSTAPGLITAGVWYWIDIVAVIDPSAGSVKLYINQLAGGPTVLSLTGVNTSGSGHAYANQFELGFITGGTSVSGMRFDDVHVHDSSGSAPNAVLGESRIFTKMPSGAGTQTNWTPNGASANWQCVDEVPPDDDTTYVSSNTAGAIDSYTLALAGLTLTPNAVVTRMRVRRDDAGPHTSQVGVRSGSTNGFGPAASINSTYSWVDAFFANDPNTSAAWSAAAADVAQVAIDETS